MITLYGIRNCDTVKRARKTLDEAGLHYRFHDFRADGLEEATLRQFLEALGRDVVINRRGTSWRNLSDDDKASCEGNGAVSVLLAQPALIKRPVFERDGELRIGFSRKDETEILAWLSA